MRPNFAGGWQKKTAAPNRNMVRRLSLLDKLNMPKGGEHHSVIAEPCHLIGILAAGQNSDVPWGRRSKGCQGFFL
jgi:hypothetical protein